MKHLMIIFSLVAVFLTGSLFAQDSETVQNKEQNHYKNQTKNVDHAQTKGQNRTGFVDENGDGIPNDRDGDYEGEKARKGNNAKGFVDADGDGINDNAIDSDGDGIPNGQDADYVRPQDGSGRMNKSGQGNGKSMKGEGNGSGMGTGTGDCDGMGRKGSA